MRNVLVVLALLALLPIIARLFAAAVVHTLSATIGNQALAQQPDEIHLVPAGPQSWNNAASADALADPLLGCGFEDAGIHRVQEMPGMLIRLLVKPDEALFAVVYEHPRVGVWLDVATRYRDGTGITFSTAKQTGLNQRPGYPIVNAPAASPLGLCERARTERPSGAFQQITIETAARTFEASYADSIAWRKARGITAVEVANVAGMSEAA
jgi:hypothetical protein